LKGWRRGENEMKRIKLKYYIFMAGIALFFGAYFKKLFLYYQNKIKNIIGQSENEIW
jgi:hypothetical protein